MHFLKCFSTDTANAKLYIYMSRKLLNNILETNLHIWNFFRFVSFSFFSVWWKIFIISFSFAFQKHFLVIRPYFKFFILFLLFSFETFFFNIYFIFILFFISLPHNQWKAPWKDIFPCSRRLSIYRRLRAYRFFKNDKFFFSVFVCLLLLWEEVRKVVAPLAQHEIKKNFSNKTFGTFFRFYFYFHFPNKCYFSFFCGKL